jgi:aldose 1-epimerase
MIDSSARTLTAGDLRAVFLPGLGMLGASLRHRGEELLGRLDEIEAFAHTGQTCGIPLLHPWANRLGGSRYQAAGREVLLDPVSSLLHFTDEGYPIEMVVTLRPNSLTIETTLIAGSSGPVPVSFGFHPYLRLPGLPRAAWQIHLPAMRRQLLDTRLLPTGEESPFAALDTVLGDRTFDDGFIALEQSPSFSIMGSGRRITIEFLDGYRYAQVYAPSGNDYLAFEPMTAPTNALATGRGLHLRV